MSAKLDKPARGDRKDAFLVRDVGAINALMPYIMPRRCDSLVYFDIAINMDKCIALAKRLNQSKEYACKITYMHFLLATICRIYQRRPHLNSYIINRRMYRRKHIDIALTIKKTLSEEAPETNAKIRFDDCETLRDVVEKTCAVVTEAKKEESSNDGIYSLLAGMPVFVLNTLFAVLRWLDRRDWFPNDLYEADPMHASAYIANLGSLRLGAPIHHLYEWGNCSLFAAMGVIEKEPVVDKDGALAVADISHVIVSIDERIGEGAKFVKDLALFKHYMENPELLLEKEPLNV